MSAISFENISKQYRLGLVSTRTLSHDLNRWWQINILKNEDPYLRIGERNRRSEKGASEYVWALQDINFELEQGEVLGIIGKNGSGKSTLLKILSRITAPTTGAVRAEGRIASLLEVGTGFHPELTGRENVYLNGAILGMRKAEIDRKFDEIVSFAAVERYIDTPVKRYSSGMRVRLGFAVAAHLEPEILIVDEVLAVGDAEFQKKAIGKMQNVSKDEGRTVIFVSHNMVAVKNLCNRGIVLDEGLTVFDGTASDAVDTYLKDMNFSDGNLLDGIYYINNNIKVDEFSINNSDANDIFLGTDDTKMKFRIAGSIQKEMKIAVEAKIYDSNNVLLGFFSEWQLTGSIKTFPAGTFELESELMFPPNATRGVYFMEVALTNPDVGVLATFSKRIKIRNEGIVGANGLPFNYSYRGFLIV